MQLRMGVSQAPMSYVSTAAIRAKRVLQLFPHTFPLGMLSYSAGRGTPEAQPAPKFCRKAEHIMHAWAQREAAVLPGLRVCMCSGRLTGVKSLHTSCGRCRACLHTHACTCTLPPCLPPRLPPPSATPSATPSASLLQTLPKCTTCATFISS